MPASAEWGRSASGIYHSPQNMPRYEELISLSPGWRSKRTQAEEQAAFVEQDRAAAGWPRRVSGAPCAGISLRRRSAASTPLAPSTTTRSATPKSEGPPRRPRPRPPAAKPRRQRQVLGQRRQRPIEQGHFHINIITTNDEYAPFSGGPVPQARLPFSGRHCASFACVIARGSDLGEIVVFGPRSEHERASPLALAFDGVEEYRFHAPSGVRPAQRSAAGRIRRRVLSQPRRLRQRRQSSRSARVSGFRCLHRRPDVSWEVVPPRTPSGENSATQGQ